jgi:hypothetical protein
MKFRLLAVCLRTQRQPDASAREIAAAEREAEWCKGMHEGRVVAQLRGVLQCCMMLVLCAVMRFVRSASVQFPHQNVAIV